MPKSLCDTSTDLRGALVPCATRQFTYHAVMYSLRAGRHSGARKTLVFAIIIGVMLIALVGPAATASNWQGATNKTGCNLNMTENSQVAIYGFGLSSGTANAVSWARINVLDPTALATSTPASAGTADVVVYDAYYTEICGQKMYSAGGDYVGFANCTTKHTVGQYAGRCDVHEVFIDQGYIDAASISAERRILCHELSHTLSLSHRDASDSCIRTPPLVAVLADHEKAHINSHY